MVNNRKSISPSQTGFRSSGSVLVFSSSQSSHRPPEVHESSKDHTPPSEEVQAPPAEQALPSDDQPALEEQAMPPVVQPSPVVKESPPPVNQPASAEQSLPPSPVILNPSERLSSSTVSEKEIPSDSINSNLPHQDIITQTFHPTQPFNPMNTSNPANKFKPTNTYNPTNTSNPTNTFNPTIHFNHPPSTALSPVSIHQFAFAESQTSMSIQQGASITVLTIPPFMTAGHVVQLASVIQVQVSSSGPFQFQVTLSLLRDGSTISSITEQARASSINTTGQMAPHLTWVDVPPPGTHTYEVQISVSSLAVLQVSAISRVLTAALIAPGDILPSSNL